MSVYKYKFSNYRAVKNAEIDIDGITVLAGENGSGKSTLSRFIYYMVKVLSEYELLIDKEAKQGLLQIVNRMERANLLFRNVSLNFPYNDLIEYLHKNTLDSVVSKLMDIVEQFGLKINDILNSLDSQSVAKARLATLFSVDVKDDAKLVDIASSIVDKLQKRIMTIQHEAEKKKNERTTDTFFELSSLVSDNLDSGQVEIDFFEDGVSLIDDHHFSPLLNLNRVIYYKTYALLDYLDKPSDFHSYLEDANDKMTDQEKMVARVIKGILGGDVILSNDDFMPVKQLHFKREDGLDIPLKQAATGLVSFSYLARLLENGYLREGTLLIIDEPEAHLHPKWIVEYAKILVMLQKYMKLKIVLSTHNPDMLAAIDAVARKQDVLDSTNFYFATPDKDNKYQYNYQKLDSIEEIFDSFNTALIKIQEYGQN